MIKNSQLRYRMNYLRAKPLIEDITHQKPSIITKRFSPRPPQKLTSSSRISNDYEQKLDTNLYADILSQPVRCDKPSRLNYPRSYLQKFVTSIVRGGLIKSKREKDIVINTTLQDPTLKVVVRPELDSSLKQFESCYVLCNRKTLMKVISNKREKYSLIAMQIGYLRKNEFNVKNFEVNDDIVILENEMLLRLSTLTEELDLEDTKGNDIEISLNGDVQGFKVLDFSKVDQNFKQVLIDKFKDEKILLRYDVNSKGFIQFVYKIIIYYS